MLLLDCLGNPSRLRDRRIGLTGRNVHRKCGTVRGIMARPKRLIRRQRRLSGTEGVDFVRCRICGDHRRVISARHLSKHEIDRETYMAEYRLSPDQLIAKEVRRLQSFILVVGAGRCIRRVSIRICILCVTNGGTRQRGSRSGKGNRTDVPYSSILRRNWAPPAILVPLLP